MENIQQQEKYLSRGFFFLIAASVIKAAVTMPLKYNSGTDHFTTCFAQNGKKML